MAPQLGDLLCSFIGLHFEFLDCLSNTAILSLTTNSMSGRLRKRIGGMGAMWRERDGAEGERRAATGAMRAVRWAGRDAVQPHGSHGGPEGPQGEAAGEWASLAA